MSDKKRQQPTFSTVGKEQKHIVAMPEKLRVEMPEINFNPQFSPQFSPEFKPILTLEPQYEIKVEPAHFSAIIEPTTIHVKSPDVHNIVQTPEIHNHITNPEIKVNPTPFDVQVHPVFEPHYQNINHNIIEIKYWKIGLFLILCAIIFGCMMIGYLHYLGQYVD
jgi:hypothetical protein